MGEGRPAVARAHIPVARAWLCAAILGAAAAPGAAASPDPRARPVLVFAAISFKEVLGAAAERFAALHPGLSVVPNCAASGVLVRQIELGAPADLFLSASAAEMDRLQGAGLLMADTRATIASNRLVVVVAPRVEPPRRFADLADLRFDRIAVANPRTAPAGVYAEQALRAAAIYDLVQARLVIGENVRQVLQYVARGEATAGLVYRTEARLAPGGVVTGPEAPAGAHEPIRYQAAIPAGAPHPGGGRELLAFLISPEGQAILARFGFLPPPAQ